MPQLDEKALRKPGFREGYEVVLGDGQAWTFPRPTFRLYPALGGDGKLVLAQAHSHDDQYRELRDELIRTDDTDHYNVMRLQVLMAGYLLLMNYDLDSRALCELLPVVFDDDANVAMWEALSDVILANPPKPSAVG